MVGFGNIAETLKAVAHPERLAILDLLGTVKGQSMNVKRIYEALHLEQSIVSKHLGILKRSGLLLKERKGNASCYSLNRDNPIAVSMINCLRHP